MLAWLAAGSKQIAAVAAATASGSLRGKIFTRGSLRRAVRKWQIAGGGCEDAIAIAENDLRNMPHGCDRELFAACFVLFLF